jgi:hypothetical protein
MAPVVLAVPVAVREARRLLNLVGPGHQDKEATAVQVLHLNVVLEVCMAPVVLAVPVAVREARRLLNLVGPGHQDKEATAVQVLHLNVVLEVEAAPVQLVQMGKPPLLLVLVALEQHLR